LGATGTAKILVPSEGKHMVIIRLDRESEEYQKFWEDVEKAERSEELSNWLEAKERRLRTTRSAKKVGVILAFEVVWEDCDYSGDYYRFYHRLKPCVDYWVNRYVRSWSRWRLSYPDFESIFWEEAWKVANDYYFWDSDFYLYETLELCFKRRGIEIVRKATKTKQGRFEHGAERLPEGFENRHPGSENTEKAVINQLLVAKMMTDPSLTGEEQEFLCVLSENPDAKDDEMAEIMGLSYRQKAWRLRKSIRKKLAKYREDALAYDVDAYKWQPQYKKKRLFDNWEKDISIEEENYGRPEFNSTHDYGTTKMIAVPDKSTKKRRRKLTISRETWLTEQLKFPLRIAPKVEKRINSIPKKKKKRNRSEDKRMKKRIESMNLPPDFDWTSTF